MSTETSKNKVLSVLGEAMTFTEESKELFNKHIQQTIVERFVPRNNATISEKLSEMESDEDEDDEAEVAVEEVNELQVSEEDPDAEKLDETNIEEDLVPTLDVEPDTPEVPGIESEPEEDGMEKTIDPQDLIAALRDLLGLGEMEPTMEPPVEPADDIEPGIHQQQEEVDENASPTADMDAPKTHEPNADMSDVKTTSPEAEQKKMNEIDDTIEIVEDEDTNLSSNIQENKDVSQLTRQVCELKNNTSKLTIENQQLKEANALYKNRLAEQNMSITKLSHLNTLFDKYPINTQVRQRIIEKFDSAKTENELTIYFESFNEALALGNTSNTKKIVVKESAKHLGNASAKQKLNESKYDPFEKFKHITDYKYGE